jgi:hypothetical protein
VSPPKVTNIVAPPEQADTTTQSITRVTLKVAEGLGGAKLLINDMRIGFLVLNEARYRTLERWLGVPREQANLVTAIGLLALADALHEHAQRMANAPEAPTVADAVLGATTLRELLYGVGGPTSRETPLFGTLITIGVIGGLARPVVGRSIGGIKASSHQLRKLFNDRYGQLVGSGRRVVSELRGDGADDEDASASPEPTAPDGPEPTARRWRPVRLRRRPPVAGQG